MYICSYIGESFIEYEGELSLVLFTPECNLNCYGCYNKDRLGQTKIKFKDCLVEHLTPLHTAIVFLGGEPTCNPYLLDMLCYVKEHFPKLKIKLFTNGTNPDIIKRVIPYIDACSVDFKTWDVQDDILGIPLDVQIYRNLVSKTLCELIANKVSVEVRTLKSPKLSEYSLEKIKDYMKKTFPTVKHLVTTFIQPKN